MAVTFSTSVTRYPRSPSHRRSHIDRPKGRALPMWMRWYTVGPQKYIPIGPGGGGRSSFRRAHESYSLIRSLLGPDDLARQDADVLHLGLDPVARLEAGAAGRAHPLGSPRRA